MARYEELKTPEAVLAAFKAGRRVERSANEGRRWTLLCTVSGVAAYIQSGWRYRALIESPAIPAGYTEQAQPSQQGEAVPTFDAGLLNDFGGGNVEWWHDYIRSLLSDAEEHYRQYIAAPAEPLGRAADGVEGLANIGEMDLTAPPSVWLQIDADGDPEDRSQPVPRGEWVNLTWHYASIGGQEVEYIRADLAYTAKASGSAPDEVLSKAIAHADELLDAYDRTVGLPSKYALGLRRLRNALRATPPTSAPTTAVVGWMNEDELPEGYPYDEMFPHSRVDGVRLFPVFAPASAPEVTRLIAAGQALSAVLPRFQGEANYFAREELREFRAALTAALQQEGKSHG